MIKLSVENLTVDDFIEVVKTYPFSDTEEFDQYAKDFFEHYKNQLKEKFKSLEELKQQRLIKENENKLEELYQDVMLVIDDRMMERGEYLERIATKNKYRGRYNYIKNGNSKRKA